MKKVCNNCYAFLALGGTCPYFTSSESPCDYYRDGTPNGKTLLDEFAMTYKIKPDVNDPLFNRFDRVSVLDRIACASYDYAAAMMRERAMRDENGNIKELTNE